MNQNMLLIIIIKNYVTFIRNIKNYRDMKIVHLSKVPSTSNFLPETTLGSNKIFFNPNSCTQSKNHIVNKLWIITQRRCRTKKIYIKQILDKQKIKIPCNYKLISHT